jgi:copper chaperone NosL
MRSPGIAALAAVTTLTLACAAGPPEPAPLEVGRVTCDHCRMTVSEARFAGQIVAPGEEPRFFDDLGCLAAYLRDHDDFPPDAAAYVADHRTSAWVRAGAAVYTRADTLATPMSSHLIAHQDAGSRDADPAAREGVAVPVSELFGPGGPPGGAR